MEKNIWERDEEMEKTLLSQLIVAPGSTKRFSNNLNVGSTIRRNNGGRDKFGPQLKTKLKGQDKIYSNKDMKEKQTKSDANKLRSDGKNDIKAKGDGYSFSLYSDGLKFFNDLGGFDDEDDDDFFSFGKNIYNNPFSNYCYGGYNYGIYGYGGYGGYGYNNYGYNYGYNYNNNYYPKKKEEKLIQLSIKQLKKIGKILMKDLEILMELIYYRLWDL